MLAFASLGSGSSGNATLVRAGQQLLLVDCGFGVRAVKQRLQLLGMDLGQLSAIILTHAHSDHSKGAEALARATGAPVLATAGTCRARGTRQWQIIRAGAPFSIGPFQVEAVDVPHDCEEPVAYIVRAGQLKLGILSDLGHATPAVIQAFHGCHGLLLEANYDPDMLTYGPYPGFLKARVGGRYGHLSNQQSVELLRALDTRLLRYLVVGHISRHNNTPAKARAAFNGAVPSQVSLQLASQERGCGWVDLASAAPEQLALL